MRFFSSLFFAQDLILLFAIHGWYLLCYWSSRVTVKMHKTFWSLELLEALYIIHTTECAICESMPQSAFQRAKDVGYKPSMERECPEPYSWAAPNYRSSLTRNTRARPCDPYRGITQLVSVTLPSFSCSVSFFSFLIPLDHPATLSPTLPILFLQGAFPLCSRYFDLI